MNRIKIKMSAPENKKLAGLSVPLLFWVLLVSLSPARAQDAQPEADPVFVSASQLVENPMAFNGQTVKADMRILQIAGKDQLLLTNYPSLAPVYQDAILFGVLLPQAKAKDLIDGQLVSVVGKMSGTAQYTTPMGIVKTVPKIKIRRIQPEKTNP